MPSERAILADMTVDPTMVPMATVLTKSKAVAVAMVRLPAKRNNTTV